jgi:hypothetical protein
MKTLLGLRNAKIVLKDNRIVSLFDKMRSIKHVAPQAGSKAGMFKRGEVKDYTTFRLFSWRIT